MSNKKNILIIGKVWPEPNSSAAGTRMMQLIHHFIGQAYTITFLSHAKQTEFQADLSRLNVNCASVEVNSSKFDALIQEMNPDIVIFDRFMTEEQFGWRVMDNCPDAIRILNTEDLHFLREARQKALKSGAELDLNSYRSDLLLRELAAIHRSDISFMVSDYEVDLLQSTYGIPKEKLVHLPFYCEPAKVVVPSYSEREDFVFIGNFWHEPNLDAVRYLKSTIWPLIKKKVPKAKLNIYGAYCSEKVYQLTNKEDRFIVHGRAENAEEVVMKSRVSLAPIRFGAGIKGKLLESMAVGTPSVTMTIGAEGIADSDVWPGQVADDPVKFAKAAVELYLNEQTWDESQKKGEAILNDKFSQTKFETSLSKAIQKLSDIENHRKSSIIGLILQRESHQASRYMSIWIEEKKKNGHGGS
jgi:glycosyltransferase involved in cell wall biosynthesis